jgi:demethylmenaquinone methyltransferase / 2-methoxy-6-polyprenyl-1,4-benzoquinol methylase
LGASFISKKIPKPGQETNKIRTMFNQIAGRYDLLNRVLSGGIDRAWRRRATRDSIITDQRNILDLACGTGDLALELRKAAHADATVIGADFSDPMLRKAQEKSTQVRISWVEADGLKLPFPDNHFDLVTIAFGIRNMESLDKALKEINRVLKPNGLLTILEFTQPKNWLIRAAYYPYFLYVLPLLGVLLSQKSAYLYLPHSVLHFPNRKQLANKMKRHGYHQVRHCALTFGIAAIHQGRKKTIS